MTDQNCTHIESTQLHTHAFQSFLRRFGHHTSVKRKKRGPCRVMRNGWLRIDRKYAVPESDSNPVFLFLLYFEVVQCNVRKGFYVT